MPADASSSRRLRELAAERRRIERRDDADAGLRVLVRDQRQQRPGTDERDAPADRHALRLQRDLRAAEREHARQGPAREGQHAVHRAGRQDQVVERLLAVAVGGQQVEAAPEHVPDQRARPVVDPVGVVAAARGGSPRPSSRRSRRCRSTRDRLRPAAGDRSGRPAVRPRRGRSGRRPARASASAARTPAGPAPTMTTIGSANAVTLDEHRHPRRDERRAGAHATPVGEPDPAVLARGHHAEAGALPVAELEAAQRRAVQQDRGDQQVAGLRLDRPRRRSSGPRWRRFVRSSAGTAPPSIASLKPSFGRIAASHPAWWWKAPADDPRRSLSAMRKL